MGNVHPQRLGTTAVGGDAAAGLRLSRLSWLSWLSRQWNKQMEEKCTLVGVAGNPACVSGVMCSRDVAGNLGRFLSLWWVSGCCWW